MSVSHNPTPPSPSSRQVFTRPPRVSPAAAQPAVTAPPAPEVQPTPAPADVAAAPSAPSPAAPVPTPAPEVNAAPIVTPPAVSSAPAGVAPAPQRTTPGAVSKTALAQAAQSQAILNGSAEVPEGLTAHLNALRSDKFRQEMMGVTNNNAPFTDVAIKAAINYVSDPTLDGYRNLCGCTTDSVCASVKRLAAVKLIANAYTGEAFLVTRGNQCTPNPGVVGWEKTLGKSFPKCTIDSVVIYDQDFIDIVEGSSPSVVFKRNMRPDKTKANEICGAYTLIRENTGPDSRVHIHTAQITTREFPKMTAGRPVLDATGKQVMSKELISSYDGRRIEPGRMGPDRACRYHTQRPAMKDVARTWAAPGSELGMVLDMARESEERIDPERETETESQGEQKQAEGAKRSSRRTQVSIKDKTTPAAAEEPGQPANKIIPVEDANDAPEERQAVSQGV